MATLDFYARDADIGLNQHPLVNLANATLAQVMVPIEDFERGTAFYRDILGLPFLFAAPPQMAFFQCGSVRLLVGVLPPDRPRQRGGALYFQVPDIQAVFGALRDKGVRFLSDPHVVHRTPKVELWLAEFKEPDQNQLALMAEKTITV